MKLFALISSTLRDSQKGGGVLIAVAGDGICVG